jgi:hypothetical protein
MQNEIVLNSSDKGRKATTVNETTDASTTIPRVAIQLSAVVAVSLASANDHSLGHELLLELALRAAGQLYQKGFSVGGRAWFVIIKFHTFSTIITP